MGTTIFRKRYSELIRLPTLEERFEYLKLSAKIGESTFGYERDLNQLFYQSRLWKDFRKKVIIRDNGCDMAMKDYVIPGRIEVHHINPITIEMIENDDPLLLDMDNVVCVSPETHKAIHYGDSSVLPKDPIERRPNDTCPWLL